VGQTRRERRLEQFGGKTYGEDAPRKIREDRPFRDREDRPARGREDGPATTREERPFRSRDDRPSSRFGRVGPPRPRSDAPSRFREERPAREREDKPSWDREDRPFRTREDRPSKDRDDKAPWAREDRPQRREERPDGMTSRSSRFDGDRPPRPGRRDTSTFGAGDRPARTGGYGDRPQRRTFDEDRPKSFQDREKERSPWITRGRQGGDRRDRKPFERDTRDRKPFERDTRGSNPFERGSRFEAREGRPEKSFPLAELQPAPYQHKHFDRKGSEEYSSKLATILTSTSARDPESLPYTTAASEFIYGHSSVLAALRANRRKLYKLYIHSRGASRDNLLTKIRALKLFGITQEVGDEYMRAMDKSSSGRPHNGIVLESSPLPVSPITELKTPSKEDESFSVTLDSQSAEDAAVNGNQELYSYKSSGWRHPLILYVDGVVSPTSSFSPHFQFPSLTSSQLDEGNLGALTRSAYFLGADAIITPTRNTAPWSHIALKASAGAAEAIPIFKVGDASDFLGKSSRNGWRVYASASVPPVSSTSPDKEDGEGVVYTLAKSSKRLEAGHSPVAEHATILMMGAEGTGLRAGLLNLAHYNVGIRHGREVDEVGVDSLNVSVAASLLCYKMLQKPKGAIVESKIWDGDEVVQLEDGGEMGVKGGEMEIEVGTTDEAQDGGEAVVVVDVENTQEVKIGDKLF